MSQPDKNRRRRLQDYKPLEKTREERAMEYHLQVQKQWEQQGKKLGKLTGRDPSTLSMFSDDEFRHQSEEKELISRVVFAIASKDIGIWKPLAKINDIYAQRETPKMDPIEIIRNPDEHENVPGQRPTNFFKSKYYKKRVKQLKGLISKLKPFEPDYEGLFLVGHPLQLDQFEALPEIEQEETEVVDQDGIGFQESLPQSLVKVELNSNRIFFTTSPGVTQVKTIEMTNRGTTAIYYKWRIAEDIDLTTGDKNNPVSIRKKKEYDAFDWRDSESFDIPKDLFDKTRSEFCFTQMEGSILPGNTIKFSFSFKSDIAGSFIQRWIVDITPAKHPYSTFMIYLRGSCFIEPPNSLSFKKMINESLHESERARCIEEIMSSVLDRVNKIAKMRAQIGEERIDGDILIDERAPLFEEANKEWGLKYSPGLFASLTSIAEECFDILEITGFDRFWDMKVSSINEMAMNMQNMEAKRKIIIKLNEILDRHSTETISSNLTYSLAYVQLSFFSDEVQNRFIKTSEEMHLDIAPFIIPKLPDPNEQDEDLDKTKKRRGASSRANARGRGSSRRGRRGKGKDHTINLEDEHKGEITPELKESVKHQIAKELLKRIRIFERLSGENSAVAHLLTRVNEMDQLDTNLDPEVDDDDLD